MPTVQLLDTVRVEGHGILSPGEHDLPQEAIDRLVGRGLASDPNAKKAKTKGKSEQQPQSPQGDQQPSE